MAALAYEPSQAPVYLENLEETLPLDSEELAEEYSKLIGEQEAG